MRIFLRELKSNIKSLVIWSVVMALLIVIAVSKFSAFQGDPSMTALFESMPKALLQMFGIRSMEEIITLRGFYGVMFIFFGLMGGIAAAMWGSDSISREERDKTVEFSLVLPVSRNKVVTAKALAALVHCVALVVITWLVSWVAVRPYHPDADFHKYLALQMAAMFIIEMIFLAIGLFLGCAMKHYKRSGGAAMAIILVAYFMSVLAGMQQKLDFLKWFTPFKYFDSVNSNRMDVSFLILSAGIIIVCVVAAYWIYNKRDLYI